LVFTTGAPFEYNVVAGVVTDRITGEVLEGARVEARAQGVDDPPVHVAVADSAGVFALRYLPAGPYDILIYVDNNRNAELGFNEMQGSAVTSPLGATPEVADTVILREVALLVPDTTPSRLAQVEARDSLHVRLAFDDYMDAEGSFEGVQVNITREDSTSVSIERLMWPRQVDSLQAISDSIAAEERRLALVDSLQVVADSLDRIFVAMEARGDTLGVDTLAPQLERIRARMAPPEPPEPEEGRPAEPPRILPQREFFVQLADSLSPQQLYSVTVSGVVNLFGTGGGGGEGSFSWEPPEPPEAESQDTAAAVPDTLVVPDTGLVVPPDTGLVAPPDTMGVPPDTSGVANETGWASGRPAPSEKEGARSREPLWWTRRSSR
jgi:hypothetical protein